MYTGLFHTHKLTITIFIILYLIKTILLITGKKEALEKFSKRFLPFEIVVSFLFLLSGIWLLFETSEIRTLFVVKIIIVVLAVPMAFIGFRKQNMVMGVLSFFLIVGAYGVAEINKSTMVKRMELPKGIVDDVSEADYDILAHGKALYDTQCIVCHGEDGTLQMSGAKDITVSKLSQDEVVQRITGGKMTMPAYGDHFSVDEINAIAEYTMTLRSE
jgi:mono/diheme cytochrome c family protein